MNVVHIEHRYFDSNNNIGLSANTYNERVIAFYPSEGFIIFQGYTTLWPERLPCKLNFYRFNNQIDNASVLYTVQVNKIWRKDLQAKPLTPEEMNKEKYKCNHKDEDDCCCNIIFFPSYLVIMEFNILEKDTDFMNKSIVNNESICNFCIDNRYSSAKQLYQAYTNLVELPEYSSFTNDHRVEDVEFYREYYDIIDMDNNIFDLTEEQMEPLMDDLNTYREHMKAVNEKRKKEWEERQARLKAENDAKPKNYLDAGAIIGINTVGASLRNAIVESSSSNNNVNNNDNNVNNDLIKRILRDINEPSFSSATG